MNREQRNRLIGGQLVLISTGDPNEAFEAGGGRQRDTLIHALADAVLVLGVDRNETPAELTGQPEALQAIPVFV
ncbi:DNA-processing protein DprA, partial [Acinetobacter baumannii]